jgi:hypothetical protein
MQSNWTAYVTLFLMAIILPVCLVYLFRFLKRRWPIPQKCRELKGAVDALSMQYRKWDYLGGLFAIGFGVVGAFASWKLCSLLCSWRSMLLVGDHLLFPKHGICLLPAVPGAIVMGVVGSLVSYKILLRSRFAEFACYGSLKLGIDVIPLLRLMVIISFIFWLIGVALPFDTYAVLSQNELKYNELMGFDQSTYRYADIKSIDQVVRIRNRFKKDVSIKILFKDGNVWHSANTEELSNDRAVIVSDYLSQKTNLPINQKIFRR